jgi:voltage-gated potassium channel
MTSAINIWRNAAYGMLEGQLENSAGFKLISRFVITLIILNVLAVILESNQLLYERFREGFNAFERFSVTIFTIEYLARAWVSSENSIYAGLPNWKARISYLLSPMALVDFLAVAPFYLALLIPIDLRFLRLFRLLRLMKLSHYFDGLQVFLTVLRRESSAMAAALLTMLILIVISACLMFMLETNAQPGHFDSIAQAIWWAVVTLTTVGYGDITPITFAGKLLGIAIMLLGVGCMALPAGILAARFSEELRSRRDLLQGRVIDAFRDGVMDPAEKQAIAKLQNELGLSDDVVKRIVTVQRQLSKNYRYCPHCGENLGDDQ